MTSKHYSTKSSRSFYVDSLIWISALFLSGILGREFWIFDEGDLSDLSYWYRFRWEIIGAISLLVVEALLIGSLINQRARRRKVEKGLQDIEGKYGTLIETTDTGYVML